jgi:ParB family transcriptional regulator, chromosome partitioning protein
LGLERIEAELAEMEAREEAWQPADVVIGGIILTIAVDGGLRIDRGYVRAEDELTTEPATPAHDDAARRGRDGGRSD